MKFFYFFGDHGLLFEIGDSDSASLIGLCGHPGPGQAGSICTSHDQAAHTVAPRGSAAAAPDERPQPARET